MSIIAIEGVDGVGKTTQAWLLGQEIGGRTFKFPDRTTPMGKLIDKHLKREWRTIYGDPRPWSGTVDEARLLDAMTFQSLQSANRMELAPEILEAASGGNVILDRYWPSGVVYGGNDGLDPDYLVDLHRWLPQPDLFLLLDSDSATIQQRLERWKAPRDRYEEHKSYLDDVICRYAALWKRMAHEHPGRWVVVDARAPNEEVHRAVLSAFRSSTESEACLVR
jgi:dTMP kinase